MGQKMQRAFAAELLAPIEELKAFVGRDLLPERIEDAGEHFDISPLAIRSHLANHGLLSPEEVAADGEAPGKAMGAILEIGFVIR